LRWVVSLNRAFWGREEHTDALTDQLPRLQDALPITLVYQAGATRGSSVLRRDDARSKSSASEYAFRDVPAADLGPLVEDKSAAVSIPRALSRRPAIGLTAHAML
jgi:hypothetical protein